MSSCFVDIVFQTCKRLSLQGFEERGLHYAGARASYNNTLVHANNYFNAFSADRKAYADIIFSSDVWFASKSLSAVLAILWPCAGIYI